MLKKLVKGIQDAIKGRPFGKKLDKEECLQQYLGHGYLAVNTFLWRTEASDQGDYKNLRQTISNVVGVSELMDRSESSRVLYRGTNASLLVDDISKIEEGMMIPFRGFTSTSTKLDIANYFTENNPRALDDVRPVVFQINVDKGRSCFEDQDAKTGEGESEVILPPAIYEVRRVTQQQNGIPIIEVDQRELLDVEDLIMDGLDYIKENINEVPKISASQIEEVRAKVKSYYNHREAQKQQGENLTRG